MPRFFVQSTAVSGDSISITGDDAYHIARALRMAVGDTLTVCDDDGTEHTCRLERIRDDRCELIILESQRGATEPPVEITLYLAYPKGDKLETVIQKAVELGALKVIPFESERCVKRPKADKIDARLRRHQRIAVEAAKQCGRSRLPSVGEPISFSEMLNQAAKHELSLFCYEGEGTRSIKEILTSAPPARRIAVIVGAEGGFSPNEAEAARNAGLSMTGLGHRILRCETAPDLALSSILYHYEF